MLSSALYGGSPNHVVEPSQAGTPQNDPADHYPGYTTVLLSRAGLSSGRGSKSDKDNRNTYQNSDIEAYINSHPPSFFHGISYFDPYAYSHHYLHGITERHIHDDFDDCSYIDEYARTLLYTYNYAYPGFTYRNANACGYIHFNVYTSGSDFNKPIISESDPSRAGGEGEPISGHMKNSIQPFLKSLISASGLSAYEGPVRSIVEEAWRPLVDELTTGRLGSLHGLRRGTGPDPRPRIMIATHMDAIGLIVSSQVGQFLHFTEIGGVDARILPGQRVIVHGREELVGVVVQPPDRLLPPSSADKPIPMEHLLIDVGLQADRLKELVRVGDLASFDQPPIELAGDTLAGHSLDNRASIAAMTICLQELNNRRHAWDVYAAATTQEEVTLGGGFTSAFEVHPDLAVAVDVTHAKGPGTTSDYGTFNLGKGVALGWGPNVHPALFNAFKEVAEDREIPFEIDPMPNHSGTDAYAMQIVSEGIPSMVLSIPLRYMHTPVEQVSMKDVHRTGRLLADFIAWLPADFVSTISFEKSS